MIYPSYYQDEWQTSRQCPPNTVPYVVQRGDYLYIIARKFNTTVAAIQASNPEVVPEKLQVGQIICIPIVQQISTCPIGSSPYEIKSGDTLSTIAIQFNTTVNTLLSSNPGISPTNLKIGQVICVSSTKPVEPVCPTSNFYVIRKGDTLSAIAKAFNVTQQSILNVNPNISPNSLRIGQIICIPLAPSPVSITVSIAAKTLSLYKQGRFVKAYPVATGKPTTPTPIGTFTIINKQVDPGGPFGTRWMGLSEPHYGIHGTNKPTSIGTAASNGCIRMYNENVSELFNQIPVGTVVRIF